MIGNTTSAENRDEGSFIWENIYDEETGINKYELALFIPREDGLYEKDEEASSLSESLSFGENQGTYWKSGDGASGSV